MSDEASWPGAYIESVIHPTDFTLGSEGAFAHGLRLAAAYRCDFSVVHADAGSVLDTEWHDYPAVRETLERWGLLEPGATREDVLPQTGVRVEKVAARGSNVVEAVLGYLEHHPADILVLSSRTRTRLARFLSRSMAEPIARRSGCMTLLVPHGRPGFVSFESGQVELREILIPISRRPRPEAAIQAVTSLVHKLEAAFPEGAELPRLTLLFAGREDEMPAVRVPDSAKLAWERIARPVRPGPGRAARAIVDEARERGVSMIAMTTEQDRDWRDFWRPSTTGRVMRAAPCPVLSVPA